MKIVLKLCVVGFMNLHESHYIFACLFFFRDVSVQFLLDNLIKIAVRVEGSLSVIQTHLMDAYKVCTTVHV